uniref:Uncharacterized protein n=1 Tax=Eutreptiella gymnastica TaxID=73025 RepID=A0A7S1NJP5_9EUGL|mmetsp:Transcript_46156/g.82430  ORF Transcript_46156/g.82430 Transcript_46156/m.82430 type:complete len:210 (+) Transcript_46156:549-1178(+)
MRPQWLMYGPSWAEQHHSTFLPAVRMPRSWLRVPLQHRQSEPSVATLRGGVSGTPREQRRSYYYYCYGFDVGIRVWGGGGCGANPNEPPPATHYAQGDCVYCVGEGWAEGEPRRLGIPSPISGDGERRGLRSLQASCGMGSSVARRAVGGPTRASALTSSGVPGARTELESNTAWMAQAKAAEAPAAEAKGAEARAAEGQSADGGAKGV